MKPEFEIAEWKNPLNFDGWKLFRVGACHGQWRSTEGAYEILSVINNKPGNGDFSVAMDYFYESCKRDKKILRIREVWNKKLQLHLIKRGFTCAVGDDFIKRF